MDVGNNDFKKMKNAGFEKLKLLASQKKIVYK